MDGQLLIDQTLKYAEGLRDLYAEERRQRRRAEEAAGRLETAYATTVRALAGALELRDDGTGAHADRVAAVAHRLTRAVNPGLASDPQLEYAFLLHDLGKIGIPDAILLKPGRLTSEEMERMRLHPLLGARLLEKIPHLSDVVRDVVLSHHERWDGEGYPHGLRGKEIPLAARIFAVADTWDAMTNDRPYRKALTAEVALAEIERGAGAQFDPELAVAFGALAVELRAAA